MSEGPRKKRLPLRWLTLAEVVGLVAVTIAGLGYWDSHRERTIEERVRSAAERERKAEQQAQARAGALKQTFLMTAAAQDAGDWLRLTSVHPEQVIQTQSLTFPSDVRADEVETTGNPRIEAGWFNAGLAKALKARGRGGKEIQDRVPVGIVTVYIEDGQTKTDPTYVRLNIYKGSHDPTSCPDCGHLVVPHNPAPGPGVKPPPTKQEYKSSNNDLRDDR